MSTFKVRRLKTNKHRLIIASVIGLCFLFTMCWPAVVLSAPKAIVKQVTGAVTIDAEGLIELYQSVKNLIIIDSRITEDRAMGYIEHSLSLADIDTNCKTLKALIPTLESTAAFYCNGPKCGRSMMATKMAVQCGYKNLYWFRGGFEEWKQKDFPYVIK